MRVSKDNYYLNIAETVLEQSTCLRRKYGAVIVKNDEIISTGYVGSPRGRKNCNDMNFCLREKLEVPRGERYELCRSVHAEQNAIIHAARKDMIESTLYLVGKDVVTNHYVENAEPCSLCKRFIINAGIKYVVIRDGEDSYRKLHVSSWIDSDETLNDFHGYGSE